MPLTEPDVRISRIRLFIRQIAAGIKVSPSYLSRIFNQEMGESISNFITRARVEKAAELLWS